MKRTKKTAVILAISLALMLISAIVGNVVIHSGGRVSVTMLEDASNKTMVDVDGTLKVFEGKVVSGALFVPKPREQAARHRADPRIPERLGKAVPERH